MTIKNHLEPGEFGEGATVSTTTNLNRLRDRVAEAKGADREIDLEIGRAFPPDAIFSDGSWFEKNDYVRFPAVTSSVDAALALVERVLPGWTVAGMSQQDDKTWFCELREGFLTSYNRVAMSNFSCGKRPASLPLAILFALLSALIAQVQP